MYDAGGSSTTGIRRGYVVAGMLGVFLALVSAKRLIEGRRLLAIAAAGSAAAASAAEPQSATQAAQEAKPTSGAQATPDGKTGTPGASAREAAAAGAAHFSDPKGSMRHFFTGLRALEKGEGGLVRAMIYGSSEIGFDRVTSQLRRRLQERFGDGGKGFVVIAPGTRYQRHRDVIWTESDNWEVYSVRFGRREGGRYGVGGVLAVNQGEAWARFRTLPADADDEGYYPFPAGRKLSHLELYYQAFPGGGEVQIAVDGDVPTRTVSTDAEQVEDRVESLDLDDAGHDVLIRTGAKETRLYGVVLERKSGFVLDTDMIIGMWGTTQLNFDAAHLRHQVELRKPDLVIFQLGAKEVFRKPNLTDAEADQFVADFAESVRRTLAGRPESSCLIVSSKDMGVQERNLVVTRPALFKVVDGARRVAAQTGCAYFDLFAAMGGAGTMDAWSKASPRLVSPDLGHLMKPGAIRIGDILSDMMLERYEAFVRGDVAGAPAASAGK